MSAEPQTKALAASQETGGMAIRSLDDVRRLSVIFVESGMFKSDKHATAKQKMYQAGVKILAGQELGLPPFAAMNSINIIEGRPEMSGNLMAALLKKHDRYDYRLKDWTAKGCTVEILERNSEGKLEAVGQYTFDETDAQAAGLTGKDNWRKYAKAMYFNRAISAAIRAYAPDVFFGIPTYVEGEIGGELVAEGEETEGDASDSTATALPAEESKPDNVSDGEAADTAAPEDPDADIDLNEDVEFDPPTVDEQYKENIHMMMTELRLTSQQRLAAAKKAIGKPFMPKTDEDWVKLHDYLMTMEPTEEAEK